MIPKAGDLYCYKPRYKVEGPNEWLLIIDACETTVITATFSGNFEIFEEQLDQCVANLNKYWVKCG